MVSEGCAAAISTIKSLDPPALELLGKITFGDWSEQTRESCVVSGGGGGGRVVVADLWSSSLIFGKIAANATKTV